MIEARRLKNVVIFIQTISSFVLSRKIINIYNDIIRKYGNVLVKDFRKYEKSEYTKNKQKLDMDFLNNCKQLGVIRNSLSLNCRMFLIKTLYQFVKDSFVAPSTSVIKNSNIFEKNSVYPKTFYTHSFLLLISTSLQNLTSYNKKSLQKSLYTQEKKVIFTDKGLQLTHIDS